jgi:hypothetical protein
MLASTVQFSNNDQPPITPGQHPECTGAGIEGRPDGRTLRYPTACPTSVRPEIVRSTLLRAVLAASDPDSGRVVNVPPMSNQHQTFADVLASDLVPKDSVRSAP